MAVLFDDFDNTKRSSYALGMSVFLHIIVLVFMFVNFSWRTDTFEKSPPAILMVDLTKVKLAEKTNLPPLVKEVKKTEPQKVEEKKVEPKKEVKPQKKPQDKTPLVKKEVSQKVEPVRPVEKKQPPKEAVKVKEEPKKVVKKEVKKQPKKEVKKQAPKKVTPPQKKVAPKPITKKQPKQSDALKSLLASVEKVRKPVSSASANKTVESQTVNKGIAGGTSGSLLSDLTISEKDLIANKIRENWNVNAGVENAEKMIVEIRVFLNKDGSLRDVRVLNMKSNPVFRSMAESAKRAIYKCDSLKEDSPFRIIAKKHPGSYNSWKEIYLRMNPVDGGVF